MGLLGVVWAYAFLEVPWELAGPVEPHRYSELTAGGLLLGVWAQFTVFLNANRSYEAP